MTGQVKKLLPEALFNSIVQISRESKYLCCEFEMKLYDCDEQEQSRIIIDIVLSKGEFEIRLYDKAAKEFA